MSSQPKAVTPSTPVDSGEIDDTNCSLCKRTFASKYHRDWHIKRMHNGSDNICLICNATFSTASAYKKHCTNQHPPTATLQYENPKQPTEGSPLKIDAFTAQENVALREKIKALKAKLKEVNKIHSMELKLLEKKTKKQLDEQVKEKDTVLVTMRQKLAVLEQSNMKVLQYLQNERMKVKMLKDTLAAVYGVRKK